MLKARLSLNISVFYCSFKVGMKLKSWFSLLWRVSEWSTSWLRKDVGQDLISFMENWLVHWIGLLIILISCEWQFDERKELLSCPCASAHLIRVREETSLQGGGKVKKIQYKMDMFFRGFICALCKICTLCNSSHTHTHTSAYVHV